MSVHPCVCVCVCVCVYLCVCFGCFVTQKQEQCAFFCPLFFQFRNSRRSCWETGRSVPSSAGCLCTSRPPSSYGQTPRPPPSARSLPRSGEGRAPPHDTCHTHTHTHTHTQSYNTHKAVGTSNLNEFVCECPPLSGQRFRFRPEDHQSAACTCCRGRPGEIGIQGARLPVQRLQPYGPHIALDRTGAGSPLWCHRTGTWAGMVVMVVRVVGEIGGAGQRGVVGGRGGGRWARFFLGRRPRQQL